MANEIQRTLRNQVVALGLPYRQVSCETDGSVIYKLPTPPDLGGLALIIKYDEGQDMYNVTRVSFDKRMTPTRSNLGLFCVEDLSNVWAK